MKTITTDGAPSPNGCYSQAVVHGGMIYLSNQLPLIPESTNMPEGIEAQMRQVMINCRSVLIAAGSDFEDVVVATVQLRDIDDWKTVDRLWMAAFTGHKPARSIIAVPAIHLDASVALQIIATCKS